MHFPLHKFTNVWHCELIPPVVIARSKSIPLVGAKDASPHPLRTPSVVVIARSESPKRRSNPLNRVAQKGFVQRRSDPLIPKGIATSCLAALLAMTAEGTAFYPLRRVQPPCVPRMRKD